MNGRRAKPDDPIAAILAAGPSDAEGRLRRAILIAIGRAGKPTTWPVVPGGALRPKIAIDVRAALDGMVDDGLLVRVDRNGREYWDLA